uniref:Receptor-type tyrosine-protein phosphatase eta-like n=1 Tax=Acanthochromis polyacanthus TaxID=80966 RepID=A0A3Q1F1Y8_9TELE
MGKFQDKVCVLTCWALMVMYNTAERQYAVGKGSLTWNGARNYCQVCFEDLVTLSHDNIEVIVKMLNSQHWIGLRKSFNSTSNYTSNSTMPWSHWSNGEPLTFQNWYPGWPKFEPSVPDNDCCGCSCNGPATTTPTMSSFTDITDPNVTDLTTFWETSTDNMTVTEDYVNITSSVFTDTTFMTSTPLPTPNGYIEDSCVAMYSFGSWVEKDCSEHLPFICYEDHFSGYFKVSVTNVTSDNATVTWQWVSDRISHYRVAVKGVKDNKEMTENKTDLTHDLVGLTPGTNYVVHVFPFKCGRELKPENFTFYTEPNKVQNLTITNVTERSIQVNWSKPDGNLDFYVIRVGDEQLNTTTEGIEVAGLTPGTSYTLFVLSEVEDRSVWSEESNITVYTKPSKVSSLNVSDNTNHSVFVHWGQPEGNFTGFLVKVLNSADEILFNDTVDRTVRELPVETLPMGTRITIVVTALANVSLEGDNTTITTYTAPGPISNLIATTSNSSLTASWAFDEGNYSHFAVRLWLDGTQEEAECNETKKTTVTFDELKTAANYTVDVHAVSGHLQGPSMKVSKFTLPSPPTNANATFVNKSAITFTWTPPKNIAKATYLVELNSTFYSQSWSDKIIDETSYTFSNLTSGTKYCFEVLVLGGEQESSPASRCTVTETEERQISLSMLCSSAETLLCDNSTTRTRVFKQLKDHFSELLKDDIVWTLEATEV